MKKKDVRDILESHIDRVKNLDAREIDEMEAQLKGYEPPEEKDVDKNK